MECRDCGHSIEAHEIHDEPPHVCHACYLLSDRSDGYGNRWCNMSEVIEDIDI